MNDHNYTELRDLVWDADICSGCSICATVCPMKTIYFDKTNLVVSTHCKNEKDSVPCGACVSCCPRLDTYKEKKGLGIVKSAVAARATIPISKKQSGGAITAIVYNAIKRGLIDAVITIGQDHATMQTYSIALTDPEKVITYAGSKYVWHTPSLLALRDVVEEGKVNKVAIIGTPCVMQAVRKMLLSDNDVLTRFKSKVALLIGVFCTEIFDYEKIIGKLADNDIALGDIKRLDIKRDLIVETYDNKVHTIPITKELEKDGCNYCLDFSAVDADIAAGSIGSDEGYTTVLTRTNTGEFYLHSAIENGFLDSVPLESLEDIRKFSERKYKKNSKNLK